MSNIETIRMAMSNKEVSAMTLSELKEEVIKVRAWWSRIDYRDTECFKFLNDLWNEIEDIVRHYYGMSFLDFIEEAKAEQKGKDKA